MSDRRPPLAPPSTCPCRGATLDKLVQPALLTLLADGPQHGYRLAERLADMPPAEGHKPDVSGVYRALRAMNRRGLVEQDWDLSDRGPARRIYTLTPAGRQCLALWVDTLEHRRKAIGALLARARRAAAPSPPRTAKE